MRIDAMRIIRYVIFLPLAVIASILAGVVGYWIGGLGIWIYEGSEFLARALSGLGSGIAFILVGLKIAPEPTERIKLLLAVLLLILGTISAIGPMLTGQNMVASITGVVMALIGVWAIRTPVSDLTI